MSIDYLYIEITNKCNFNCRHCQNLSGPQNDSALEYELLSSLNDDLDKARVKHIVLSGGEPGLHPDFLDIALDLLSSCRGIDIITNGYTLIRFGDLLKPLRNHITFGVSLDGYDCQSFEQIRGNGNFNTIVSAIRHYRSIGFNIRIKTTLTKYTLPQYRKFIQLATNLAVPIKFGFLNPVGRAIQTEALHLQSGEIDCFLADLSADERKLFPIGSCHNIPECTAFDSSNHYRAVKIDCEGNMYTCLGFHDPLLSIANLNNTTISAALEDDNPTSKRFEQYMMLHGRTCNGCAYEEKCSGSCPVMCSYYYNCIAP